MPKEIKLQPTELIIFAIIYSFSENGQTFSGSIRYLTQWTNKTKRTIISTLKSLVEKDLIIKETAVNGNIYQVNYCNEVVKKFHQESESISPGDSEKISPNLFDVPS